MRRIGKKARWLIATILFPLAAGAADAEKLIFALPAVPPVFGGVVALVAKDAGQFKKYGLDVDVKPFDSGAAAAQAVVAGNVDLSLSPTPVVVRMISNANVNLVAVYGMENPDWLLASTDPKLSKCEDLKGQAVGVDSIGGARAVALAQFLRPCGLKVEDVKLVALSSNVSPAMIAGQLKFGVLHLDDVPVMNDQLKRPVTLIADFKKVNPLSHYLAAVVTTDRLKQKRDTYVRVLAALIDATNYMRDPKNADRVAQIATATGRTPAQAKEAMVKLWKIDFWPVGHDGLTKANLDSVIAVEKEIGGIKQGKEPVAYERLVDHSVWKDASGLVKKGSSL